MAKQITIRVEVGVEQVKLEIVVLPGVSEAVASQKILASKLVTEVLQFVSINAPLHLKDTQLDNIEQIFQFNLKTDVAALTENMSRSSLYDDE